MQTSQPDLAANSGARQADALRELQEGWSRFLAACADKTEPSTADTAHEQRLLEPIKRLPEVTGLTDRYRFALQHIDSFERAAVASYGDALPRPVTEAHLLFCHRNALSDFVGAFGKACDANASIADGLARYRDDAALPDPCLLPITDHQYRLLYTAFVFGWLRDEPHPDLTEVFALRGLAYLGKVVCASGEPDGASEYQSPDKVWREIRKRSPLAELRTAAASDNKARLAEDLIQYLAIVCRAAAAGALDPADATDHRLAETAAVIIADLSDAVSS